MALEGGYAAASQFKSISDSAASAAESAIQMASSFAAIAASMSAVSSAINAFAQLEQTLRLTNTVAQGTADQMKAMDVAVRNLALGFKQTAAEGASALYFLASAGLSVKESIEALNAVTLLSQATLTNLSTTADTVANTLSVFSLEATESMRVANLFAAAISVTQATMDKLSFSLRYVGPVAASMGAQLEDVVIALSGLYNAGNRGQQAGTILREVLVRLLNPSKEAAEIFGKLGLSVLDSEGKVRNFVDILKEMQSLNLSPITLAKLFETRGVSGAQTLLRLFDVEDFQRRVKSSLSETDKETNSFREKVRETMGGVGQVLKETTTEWEFLEAAERNTQFATKLALEQVTTLSASFSKAKNAITEFGITFGEVLSPALKIVTDAFTAAAIALRGMDDQTKNIIFGVPALIGVFYGLAKSLELVLRLSNSVSNVRFNNLGVVNAATEFFGGAPKSTPPGTIGGVPGTELARELAATSNSLRANTTANELLTIAIRQLTAATTASAISTTLGGSVRTASDAVGEAALKRGFDQVARTATAASSASGQAQDAVAEAALKQGVQQLSTTRPVSRSSSVQTSALAETTETQSLALARERLGAALATEGISVSRAAAAADALAIAEARAASALAAFAAMDRRPRGFVNLADLQAAVTPEMTAARVTAERQAMAASIRLAEAQDAEALEHLLYAAQIAKTRAATDALMLKNLEQALKPPVQVPPPVFAPGRGLGGIPLSNAAGIEPVRQGTPTLSQWQASTEKAVKDAASAGTAAAVAERAGIFQMAIKFVSAAIGVFAIAEIAIALWPFARDLFLSMFKPGTSGTTDKDAVGDFRQKTAAIEQAPTNPYEKYTALGSLGPDVAERYVYEQKKLQEAAATLKKSKQELEELTKEYGVGEVRFFDEGTDWRTNFTEEQKKKLEALQKNINDDTRTVETATKNMKTLNEANDNLSKEMTKQRDKPDFAGAEALSIRNTALDNAAKQGGRTVLLDEWITNLEKQAREAQVAAAKARNIISNNPVDHAITEVYEKQLETFNKLASLQTKIKDEVNKELVQKGVTAPVEVRQQIANLLSGGDFFKVVQDELGNVVKDNATGKAQTISVEGAVTLFKKGAPIEQIIDRLRESFEYFEDKVKIGDAEIRKFTDRIKELVKTEYGATLEGFSSGVTSVFIGLFKKQKENREFETRVKDAFLDFENIVLDAFVNASAGSAIGSKLTSDINRIRKTYNDDLKKLEAIKFEILDRSGFFSATGEDSVRIKAQADKTAQQLKVLIDQGTIQVIENVRAQALLAQAKMNDEFKVTVAELQAQRSKIASDIVVTLERLGQAVPASLKRESIFSEFDTVIAQDERDIAGINDKIRNLKVQRDALVKSVEFAKTNVGTPQFNLSTALTGTPAEQMQQVMEQSTEKFRSTYGEVSDKGADSFKIVLGNFTSSFEKVLNGFLESAKGIFKTEDNTIPENAQPTSGMADKLFGAIESLTATAKLADTARKGIYNSTETPGVLTEEDAFRQNLAKQQFVQESLKGAGWGLGAGAFSASANLLKLMLVDSIPAAISHKADEKSAEKTEAVPVVQPNQLYDVFERAAQRVSEAARPPGGRYEGAATTFLEKVVPVLLETATEAVTIRQAHGAAVPSNYVTPGLELGRNLYDEEKKIAADKSVQVIQDIVKNSEIKFADYAEVNKLYFEQVTAVAKTFQNAPDIKISPDEFITKFWYSLTGFDERLKSTFDGFVTNLKETPVHLSGANVTGLKEGNLSSSDTLAQKEAEKRVIVETTDAVKNLGSVEQAMKVTEVDRQRLAISGGEQRIAQISKEIEQNEKNKKLLDERAIINKSNVNVGQYAIIGQYNEETRILQEREKWIRSSTSAVEGLQFASRKALHELPSAAMLVAQGYSQAVDSIAGNLTSLITGQTKTWREALQKTSLDIANFFLKAAIKGTLVQGTSALLGQNSGIGSLLGGAGSGAGNTVAMAGNTTALTALTGSIDILIGTLAGNTAATSVDTVSTAANTIATGADTTAEIANTAATVTNTTVEGSSLFAKAGGAVSGLFGGLFAHSGGYVGEDGFMRFHKGGMNHGSMNLKHDEMPAVLQKGEIVLSRAHVHGLHSRAAEEGQSLFDFLGIHHMPVQTSALTHGVHRFHDGVMLPPVYVAPSGNKGSLSGAYTGGGNITQSQYGSTRRQPISDTLFNQLEQAGQAIGVDVVVISGGQPAFGKTGVDRTGSHRHDFGNAADIQLQDAETGRFLDMTNPADQARMSAFMSAAVGAGASGIGAATNYMGPTTIHVGGGSTAAWGAKGSTANTPQWVRDALTTGLGLRGQPASYDLNDLSSPYSRSLLPPERAFENEGFPFSRDMIGDLGPAGPQPFVDYLGQSSGQQPILVPTPGLEEQAQQFLWDRPGIQFGNDPSIPAPSYPMPGIGIPQTAPIETTPSIPLPSGRPYFGPDQVSVPAFPDGTTRITREQAQYYRDFLDAFPGQEGSLPPGVLEMLRPSGSGRPNTYGDYDPTFDRSAPDVTSDFQWPDTVRASYPNYQWPTGKDSYATPDDYPLAPKGPRLDTGFTTGEHFTDDTVPPTQTTGEYFTDNTVPFGQTTGDLFTDTSYPSFPPGQTTGEFFTDYTGPGSLVGPQLPSSYPGPVMGPDSYPYQDTTLFNNPYVAPGGQDYVSPGSYPQPMNWPGYTQPDMTPYDNNGGGVDWSSQPYYDTANNWDSSGSGSGGRFNLGPSSPGDGQWINGNFRPFYLYTPGSGTSGSPYANWSFNTSTYNGMGSAPIIGLGGISMGSDANYAKYGFPGFTTAVDAQRMMADRKAAGLAASGYSPSAHYATPGSALSTTTGQNNNYYGAYTPVDNTITGQGNNYPIQAPFYPSTYTPPIMTNQPAPYVTGYAGAPSSFPGFNVAGPATQWGTPLVGGAIQINPAYGGLNYNSGISMNYGSTSPFAPKTGLMFHEGGMVPEGGTPRYHEGLGTGEYNAILQRGERVLSINDNSQMVSLLSSLIDRVGMIQVGSNSGGGRGSNTYNLNNNIYPKDPDTFRKGGGQILSDAAVNFQRMAVRNN